MNEKFKSCVAVHPCSYAHRVSIPSPPRAAKLRFGHSSPLRKNNLALKELTAALFKVAYFTLRKITLLRNVYFALLNLSFTGCVLLVKTGD